MPSRHSGSALESELSACQSEVSRLNRVNSRLLADNTKLEKLVKQLESEIEKLGGKRVEKDSTNSSVPPSQQSIAAQTALRTRSLREPSGRKSGGQEGHEGHELAKTDSPSCTEEHKAKVCPHCGAVIGEDVEQICDRDWRCHGGSRGDGAQEAYRRVSPLP